MTWAECSHEVDDALDDDVLGPGVTGAEVLAARVLPGQNVILYWAFGVPEVEHEATSDAAALTVSKSASPACAHTIVERRCVGRRTFSLCTLSARTEQHVPRRATH